MSSFSSQAASLQQCFLIVSSSVWVALYVTESQASKFALSYNTTYTVPPRVCSYGRNLVATHDSDKQEYTYFLCAVGARDRIAVEAYCAYEVRDAELTFYGQRHAMSKQIGT